MESEAKDKGSSPQKPAKFAVYQNPALSAALTANSLKPSKNAPFFVFLLSLASAFTLLLFVSRESTLIDALRVRDLPEQPAYLFAKGFQTLFSLVFIGTIVALAKAFSFGGDKNSVEAAVKSLSEGTKDQLHLSNRQLELLGLKIRNNQVTPESSGKPPKSKPPTQSDALFPIHQTFTSPASNARLGSEKSSSGTANKISPFGTPSKSPTSPSSFYLVLANGSPQQSARPSPGRDAVLSSPWSNKRASPMKEITSEEQFQQLLSEVNDKITESAGKLATPPPTAGSFGFASPNVIVNSATPSGTTRSAPLRPVRMSPGSQKFTTPPKKGEGELPSPMSIEEAIEGFGRLGIYPQIENWRDWLRQWFSSDLLRPLLKKIETSHIQVMQSAARLGITVTINQVGSDMPTTGTLTAASPADRTKDWQPSYTLDEDGLLHQLRATLIQNIDASMTKLALSNQQQQPQANPMITVMQECADAITEHQRLQALMKGEWVKGLLPHASVRADYMVQRIAELAEGTCVKNFEYYGSGEVYDKKYKTWTHELPTDSHLLLYLFCAFLEHPKWMLHVDPMSYIGAQSSKNPLFLGGLPPKERFPEKYIAVISGVPATLHPGACILAVAKQSPPIFALFWEKKPQFSLQGRTALWDSLLVLCHQIKDGYGATVRGMHLGSSALNLLQVLELEPED